MKSRRKKTTQEPSKKTREAEKKKNSIGLSYDRPRNTQLTKNTPKIPDKVKKQSPGKEEKSGHNTLGRDYRGGTQSSRGPQWKNAIVGGE